MSVNFQPTPVKFAKDSYIIVEGKPNADRFYIIKEGTVRITREADKVMPEANLATTGEMFGVVSAMSMHSYIESVMAVTDVTLLAVERKQYGALIRKSTPVAINTIKQFSQRLRNLDQTFSRLALKSSAQDDASHLYHVGEYYESVGKSSQALYAYQQYLSHCPSAENTELAKKRIEKLKSRVPPAKYVNSPDTMVQKYSKDTLLFAEGESGNNLYIIQAGSVKITKIVNQQEVVLAVLGKGDIFGEMAMLEDKPRAATAEIYEDCILLAVNRQNFSNLINDQPEMVVRLTTLMSERIWLLYRQLSNTLMENPMGRTYDALLIQLEKNHVDLSSTEAYQCSFGLKELTGMAGIAEAQSRDLCKRIIEAKKVSLNNDKILVTNVSEVFREVELYRRAQKMGKDIKDKS